MERTFQYLTKIKWLPILICYLSLGSLMGQEDYSDGYVNNDGVNIHYVTKGNGPALIFLHGFPDFWLTWKYQMDRLANDYKVIGMDLRGYNKSDQPLEVDSYQMRLLMSDVIAVIDQLSPEGAILVANDWGGIIAWYVSIYYPHKVKGLIACNVAHPLAFRAYLKEQPQTGSYTNKLMAEDAPNHFNPERLMEITAPPDSLKAAYLQAFKRTDVRAMLNYYHANYPKPGSATNSSPPTLNKVKSKVLMIHGLQDQAFPPGTLNNTWDFLEKGLTLFTIPDGGHFIQREKPEQVYQIIKTWLSQSP